MGIESNKEAMAMMQRALGSMEGKIREAYNKGYHDGLKEGINQTTQKLVSKILEEVEADTPQTDMPKCRNEKYYKSCEYEDNCNPTVCFKALDEFQEAVTDCEACELDGKADVCKICRVSNYEPQTDCPWK